MTELFDDSGSKDKKITKFILHTKIIIAKDKRQNESVARRKKSSTFPLLPK